MIKRLLYYNQACGFGISVNLLLMESESMVNGSDFTALVLTETVIKVIVYFPQK